MNTAMQRRLTRTGCWTAAGLLVISMNHIAVPAPSMWVGWIALGVATGIILVTIEESC
jgi:hypothetical protein